MRTAAIGQIAAQRLAAVNLMPIDAAQRHHGGRFSNDHFRACGSQRDINAQLRHQLRYLRPGGDDNSIAAIGRIGGFYARHLATGGFKARDRAVLNDFAAEVLQRPGISLNRALRVGMAAKFIVHAAKAIVARQRNSLLHLLNVKQLDRVVEAGVAFRNEAILFPLTFGHRDQDAALLMLCGVAKQFIHLRPKPLFFIEQGAGIM